jgi:hypothetical protein
MFALPDIGDLLAHCGIRAYPKVSRRWPEACARDVQTCRRPGVSYVSLALHCFCCLGSRSGKYLGTDSGEGGQAPSIVFIDEIDAVGTKRYDSTSGGEREIQRTMLELLNQVTTAPPPFLSAKFSLPLHHRTLLE